MQPATGARHCPVDRPGHIVLARTPTPTSDGGHQIRHAAEASRVVTFPSRPALGCENLRMAAEHTRITITEPGIAGSYELVERREDGSLLLRPERERLSDVIRESEGVVFKDEEFIAHLQRIRDADDDLPDDVDA